MLRNGYTTGSCSAAAVKASATELVSGLGPTQVELILPVCEKARWEVCKVTDEPADEAEKEYIGYWKVQKDSGDDPDVTNGTWIYARTSWITESELERRKETGFGYWLEEYPQIYLTGGTGIGIVTLPGLSCPVGHYAINPVPRKMIIQTVSEVLASKQHSTEISSVNAVLIELAIPAGVTLAEKTFNPRLGIQGGISVLGTTGILRPMSEDALLETIKLDIHMKVLEGQDPVIMTPGNYGETFLKEQMGIDAGKAVICSNYVADALEMMQKEQVKNVLFVGHIGKLIKVAAGMRNTHSRFGDRRMETLEAVTCSCIEYLNRRVGQQRQKSTEDIYDTVFWIDNEDNRRTILDKDNICEKVRESNTTEEVIGFLKQILICNDKMTLADLVMTQTARDVKRQLMIWSEGTMNAEVVVFSSAHQIIGNTGYKGM